MAEDEFSSEPVREFCTGDHPGNILQNLKGLRDTGTLCDIVLVVGNREIFAHRAVMAAGSQYFASIYRSDYTETHASRIELGSLDAGGVETVVQYIYTGVLRLTLGNVHVVLAAATHLDVLHLKDYCRQFLSDNISLGTCLSVWAVADLYDMDQLKEQALKFILDNFTEIMVMEDVLELPMERLLELLFKDALFVDKEEDLFELVVRWTKYDIVNRKAMFPKLLASIRTPLMDLEYVINNMKSEPLLKEFPECLSLTDEAVSHLMRPQLLKESPPTSLNTRPRLGTLKDVIVVCGGQSEAVLEDGSRWTIANVPALAYIIDEDRWVDLKGSPPRNPVEIFNLSDTVYVANKGNPDVRNTSTHKYRFFCYNTKMEYGARWVLPQGMELELPGVMSNLMRGGMLTATTPQSVFLLDTLGWNSATSSHLRVMFSFDTITKRWHQLSNLPDDLIIGYLKPLVITVGEDLYVLNGTTVFRYNQSLGWTRDSFYSLPWHNEVTVLQTLLKANYSGLHYSALPESSGDLMDITARIRRGFPNPNLEGCSVCVYKKDIYVIGGLKDYFMVDTVYKYNCKEQQWQEQCKLPTPRSCAMCCYARVPYRAVMHAKNHADCVVPVRLED
ncbi:KLHL11 [Branchiostoma lanceolatum]|uniref:KLHL11 protein n=1 Tax=Branchiostoma lanceolatum TaxID=7740 RepID=A0A8J9ZTD6_BRALA|nr:KLHL11 [Branchiostoma lanceolatum]